MTQFPRILAVLRDLKLQAALSLLFLLALALGLPNARAQTNLVTGFIRAPGSYDLGKGNKLDITQVTNGPLDIRINWATGHSADSQRRTPIQPGSWFVYVESPQMVWLAFDDGRDLRAMMTDDSGHGGFGGVSSNLFATCPVELRSALPGNGPKNLVPDDVPLHAGFGGESPAGVGIHLSWKTDKALAQIVGIVRASPAAHAGIKPGSFLLSINGTNTAAHSPEQCRQMVAGRAGTSVVLEVTDPERQQTNQLTLERRNSIISD